MWGERSIWRAASDIPSNEEKKEEENRSNEKEF